MKNLKFLSFCLIIFHIASCMNISVHKNTLSSEPGLGQERVLENYSSVNNSNTKKNPNIIIIILPKNSNIASTNNASSNYNGTSLYNTRNRNILLNEYQENKSINNNLNIMVPSIKGSNQATRTVNNNQVLKQQPNQSLEGQEEKLDCNVLITPKNLEDMLDKGKLEGLNRDYPPTYSYLNSHPGNTCPLCKKIFTSKQGKRRHIKTVHYKQCDYECRVCNKQFRDRYHLKIHYISRHMSKTDSEACKPFKCDDCKKKFIIKGKLNDHINIVHKGIKPYSCEECFRKFSNLGNLRRHKETHDPDRKKYSCGCGKTFFSWNGFRQHAKSCL